jgi:hypothetical protein
MSITPYGVSPPPLLPRTLFICTQAIALRPNHVDHARAMEAISRTGGGNYVVGNTMNIVTRSQYGRRLPQNLTRDVRQARILVGPVGEFYSMAFVHEAFRY